MKIKYLYKHPGGSSAIVECEGMNRCTICLCECITIAINGRKAIVRCNKCGADFDDTIRAERIRLKWFVEQMIAVWNEDNEAIEVVDVAELQSDAKSHRSKAEACERKADYFSGNSEWTTDFDVDSLRKRTYIRYYYIPHNTAHVKYGWIDSELKNGHYDVQVDDGYEGARGMTVMTDTITAIAKLPKGKEKPDFNI